MLCLGDLGNASTENELPEIEFGNNQNCVKIQSFE